MEFSASQKLSPLYVIQSEDELLTLEWRDELLAFLQQQGFSERKLYTQGTSLNWSEVLGELSSPSFFNDKCIYDIRLPEAKVGRDGGVMIGKIAELANHDNVVIFSLPLDWVVQKTAWMKELTDRAVNVELKMPSVQELPQWLSRRLRKEKVTLSPEALGLLTEWVDGNLLAANQEIIKIAMLFSGKTVSADELQTAISNVSHYGANDLRVAFMQGDWKRALRIIDRLEGEGESPMAVSRLINDDIHKAMKVYASIRSGTSEFEAMRSERLFYERAKQMTAFIGRVDKMRLYHVLLGAEHIDMAAKGALLEDIWSLFRRLCMTLAHTDGKRFLPDWQALTP